MKGYPGAVGKSFSTLKEATNYVNVHKGGKPSSTTTGSKAPTPKSSASKSSTSKGPAPQAAPSVAKIEPSATKTVTEKKPSPNGTVRVPVQESVPLQHTTSVPSKTEAPVKSELALPPTYHRFKSKPSSPPEPPFKTFLDGTSISSKSNRKIDIQTPELPPLADPELFNDVFFQDFSDSESKFMPHYGDALLKAMTFDVLSELLGKDNFKAVSNVMALAISNAFYEQIVLHYGLDKLFLCERSSAANPSKGRTHRRGDLLEAYMAATEKDISREGQGYREIREWLFRVLALRLRRLSVQDGSTVCSSGTEQKSLTILPSISGGTSITHFATEMKGSNTFASETGPVFTLTSSEAVTPSCCKATTLWNPRNCQNPSQSPIENNQFMTMESPSNTSRSADLKHFRRFLFENMRHTFAQTYKPNSWNVKSFWSTLSCHLSQLQDMLDDEREMILLFYYRV